MCGILGIISFKDSTYDPHCFNEALKMQEHRGPDDNDILEAKISYLVTVD